MPAGLFAQSTLPGISFGWRFLGRKSCLHPCRGAGRGGTKPVVSLTLDHRLQAWMPPASHSDALVWFFWFCKMPSCRLIRSASRKCSLSPIRTRTTPLSRSNAHSTAFQFRPGPDTSGNRISEVMPLLYSHDPPKTARNLFRKMLLCRWIRPASRECSVSPIRNRTQLTFSVRCPALNSSPSRLHPQRMTPDRLRTPVWG